MPSEGVFGHEGEAAVRGWPASRRANGGSLRGSLESPARPITRGPYLLARWYAE
jgi:hypothetical protein